MVGQFRPTQQSRSHFRPAPDLLVFSMGFVTSASLVFFLIHEGIGSRLRGSSLGPRLAAAAIGTAFLAAADYRRMRAGHCSVGPRRQTPKSIGSTWLGVLSWGLDTGTGFTTVRSTALPFVGALLTGLGFGSPWIGLAYAGGFLTVLWIMCHISKPTSERSHADPVWVSTWLDNFQPAARLVAVAMTIAVSAFSALVAVAVIFSAEVR